jgi:hypothetical protein
MSIFDDPEVRREKKIKKIARNGAYAFGGGVGLWFMNALYPYEDGAEHIAELFGWLAFILIGYGLVTLATVMFKRKLVFPVNALLNWLVLPAMVLYLFTKYWNGLNP